MFICFSSSIRVLYFTHIIDTAYRARQWVAQRLKFDDVEQVSLFEITIRVLGGLLSAYELSGDSLFLQKAEDLGARMLPHYTVPGRGAELQITPLLGSEYILLHIPDTVLKLPWRRSGLCRRKFNGKGVAIIFVQLSAVI